MYVMYYKVLCVRVCARAYMSLCMRARAYRDISLSFTFIFEYNISRSKNYFIRILMKNLITQLLSHMVFFLFKNFI